MDILLIGNDENRIKGSKNYLDEAFKIKDLGPAHYFLGLEVLPMPSSSVLTQRKFVKELLNQFRDPNVSPVICPLEIVIKLQVEEGDLFHDPTLYKKIVRKLNFLINTRLALAFAVQHLSQFMQAPRTSHCQAMQHVLRYLKGQPDLGILSQRGKLYIGGIMLLRLGLLFSDQKVSKLSCCFLWKKPHFLEIQETRHCCLVIY